MSTIKVTNIQSPDSGTNDIIIDANGHVTIDGVQLPSSGPLSGTRNRIINGDMRIDQRNAGASVTPADTNYTLDRWTCGLTQSSKFTVQQSTTAPSGFSHSLLVTSSSAYSVTSSDLFRVSQLVEGFNFSDMAWGTASAKTITLSFYVRSSLTGTFGGSLVNSANNRSYPFTYSISSSDTWEQKTVSIAGDTSGTWIGGTNGIGVRVNFSLGAGSTFSGTAGAWAGALYTSATGATSVVGTSGATFYITGVQLEAGSVATPFEHRSYGQELARCQRYYYEIFTSDNSREGFGPGTCWSVSSVYFGVNFPVTMRAYPTFSGFTAGNGPGYLTVYAGGTVSYTNDSSSILATQRLGINGAMLYTTNFVDAGSGVGGSVVTYRAGDGAWVEKNDANLKANFSAEL